MIVPVPVKRSLVSVAGDGESARESLPHLLTEFGCAPPTRSSAQEFLASDSIDRTKCLILDMAMPGMTGPDPQHEFEASPPRDCCRFHYG